ncbi:uncharacterized protein LOC115880505 [Sitophilus oryzae]|uniref:Uncharacterized protein LOC115880505 n=1 Tax=Sitophilus oryzae TaxID=7048 RepID=A0A6J2XR90_SITOR|nr:uncharacterized protein LOC115880505 [Sitophilus oryzae]
MGRICIRKATSTHSQAGRGNIFLFFLLVCPASNFEGRKCREEASITRPNLNLLKDNPGSQRDFKKQEWRSQKFYIHAAYDQSQKNSDCSRHRRIPGKRVYCQLYRIDRNPWSWGHSMCPIAVRRHCFFRRIIIMVGLKMNLSKMRW